MKILLIKFHHRTNLTALLSRCWVIWGPKIKLQTQNFEIYKFKSLLQIPNFEGFFLSVHAPDKRIRFLRKSHNISEKTLKRISEISKIKYTNLWWFNLQSMFMQSFSSLACNQSYFDSFSTKFPNFNFQIWVGILMFVLKKHAHAKFQLSSF
jgi:hypothetical protein